MKLRSFLITLSVACILLAGCEQPHQSTIIAQQKKKVVAPSPMIIEIIARNGVTVNRHPLTDMKDYGILEIREWKNHVVIYAETIIPKELLKTINHDFADDIIKIYNAPFYLFDRNMCVDSEKSVKVQRVILTANLVADPKLQQEYLNYHKTQFQKWPEVSQGFCRARFQQLMVFKSGRQLMLMISIPEGEDFDKLNPLTSKNNPRVDEWNKLMAKYQEGIAGTKKGETWIFLKKPLKEAY